MFYESGFLVLVNRLGKVTFHEQLLIVWIES